MRQISNVTRDRWLGRPWLSRAVRFLIYAVPFLCSILAALALSTVIPAAPSWPVAIVRLVAIAVGSTVVLYGADRLTRRMLPLAALLSLTLVFPDEAPSRFKIAMRSGGTVELQRRLEEYRRVGANEPAVAAQRLLELVADLSQHDRLTRGHSERVRAYSQMIGAELGLSEAEIDKLRWAALLHDIGKLEVPFEILNKTDPLTADEYETIRRHPGVGARLTAPLAGWLGDSVRAVGEHHERWDGHGYPNGLRGTDISLAARIVAVADTFDVMTSVRSYKKPGAAVDARTELARCAGTQFDVNVVRAFLSISLGKLRLAMGPLSWLTQLSFFPSGLVGAAAAAPALMAAAGLTAAALGTAGAPHNETHRLSTPAAAEVTVVSVADPSHPSNVTVSVPAGSAHPITTRDVTSPGVVPRGDSAATTSPVSTTHDTTVTGTSPQVRPTVVPVNAVDQTVPISRSPTPPTAATTAVPRTPSPSSAASDTTTTAAAPATPAPPTTPPPTTTAPPTTASPTTAPPTIPPPLVATYLLGSSASGDVVSQAVLPLVARAPLNTGVVPNLDTDHDSSPGRYLKRSSGLSLGNTDKVQRFRLDPPGTIGLNGPASLVLFAGAKDLLADSVQAQATLLDCLDVSGSCTTFATATVTFTGTSGQFAPVTFDFGPQTVTLAASHNLELSIIVTPASTNDMWMAYDTTGFESALSLTS